MSLLSYYHFNIPCAFYVYNTYVSTCAHLSWLQLTANTTWLDFILSLSRYHLVSVHRSTSSIHISLSLSKCILLSILVTKITFAQEPILHQNTSIKSHFLLHIKNIMYSPIKQPGHYTWIGTFLIQRASTFWRIPFLTQPINHTVSVRSKPRSSEVRLMPYRWATAAPSFFAVLILETKHYNSTSNFHHNDKCDF